MFNLAICLEATLDVLSGLMVVNCSHGEVINYREACR